MYESVARNEYHPCDICAWLEYHHALLSQMFPRIASESASRLVSHKDIRVSSNLERQTHYIIIIFAGCFTKDLEKLERVAHSREYNTFFIGIDVLWCHLRQYIHMIAVHSRKHSCCIVRAILLQVSLYLLPGETSK